MPDMKLNTTAVTTIQPPKTSSAEFAWVARLATPGRMVLAQARRPSTTQVKIASTKAAGTSQLDMPACTPVNIRVRPVESPKPPPPTEPVSSPVMRPAPL